MRSCVDLLHVVDAGQVDPLRDHAGCSTRPCSPSPRVRCWCWSPWCAAGSCAGRPVRPSGSSCGRREWARRDEHERGWAALGSRWCSSRPSRLAQRSVSRPAASSHRLVVCTDSSMRRSCVTSRTRAVEAVERLLELLDRRQVEVVGRLVEHQQVHPAGLQQGERGAGALAGRERGGGRVAWSAVSPNLASRVRTSALRPVDLASPNARTSGSGPRNRPRAWSISPTTHARPEPGRPLVERDPPEQRAEQRRLARAVGPGDDDAVGPVDLERPPARA